MAYSLKKVVFLPTLTLQADMRNWQLYSAQGCEGDRTKVGANEI